MIRRALACVLLVVALSWAAAQDRSTPAADPEAFRARVAPFLKQHCLSCHGPEKQKGQIRLDLLADYRSQDAPLWTQIHEKVSSGTMPPDERPRPAETGKRAFLSWIEKEQKVHRSAGTRRLNRRELSAALQALTGLGIDFASALPGDGTVDGFDTGAEGLQDAADSVDQILLVTRRAVEALRFLEPPPAPAIAADLGRVPDARKALEAWKTSGIAVSVRGFGQPGQGLFLEPTWLGEQGGLTIHVPPPARRRGVLRLKVAVSASKKLSGIPTPQLWVEIGGKVLDYREVAASAEKPLELVYEVQIDDLAIQSRGIGISLNGKVEVPYAVDGFENEDRGKPEEKIPGGTGLFRPAFDRKKLPPREQPVPFVVLHGIEIVPDYVAAWPPAEGRADVGTVRDNPESARRLLKLWMERAYRRPVNAVEEQPFLALYRKRRGEGDPFDAALRAAFHSVLLSAPFRYLAPAPEAHAVASRLSFMLSGGPPDAELLRLAAAGALGDPAVLDQQVDRLLRDSRSSAFVRPFVAQWLELGQPITVAMDHLQKQDFRFGRYLKASLHEETVAYVAELFAANRSARELLVSDWTMMNDILAIHYGYEGVRGGHLRRVSLRPGDPRGGGILGHAGIQSMLCWMGDNWVIYRGAWALRHVLDAPPPPPPLEVPELSPSDPQNHGKTFKEMLRRHQSDSKCAVCHKTIDPLGFAFQNFDLSGRWRPLEYEKYDKKELDGRIEWRGVGKTRPVDAAGRLPRGEEFTSYAEFKELLVRNYPADLVRGLLKNLLIYATGRRPDIADLAEVKAILQEQAPKGYPLRDLVKAVVRSRAFLGRE